MIKTYIATSVIDIIALLFLSRLLHNNNILDNRRKKPFLYGIVLTILVILAEAWTILFGGGSTELRSLNIFFNVIGFALTPIIPIILIAIFDIKTLQKHVLLLLPTLLNIVAAVLSPLYGLLFTVDVNNHYERGNIFLVFVIVYIINILFLVIITLCTSKKYLYPIKGKILSLSLFTVAGTGIQLLVPSVYSSWHCVTLSLFLYYLLLSEFDGSFDTLTGLYNRAAFEKDLKQFESRKMFSVIVMDINDFKKINDTCGHKYGDTVLEKVAAIIRESFDNLCSCYRIGGDEFCVICRDANYEKLEHQLGRMTENLSEERQNDSCLPTVAYGYSIFESDKTPYFQNIFKEADDQMYYFKKLQKNGEYQTE